MKSRLIALFAGILLLGVASVGATTVRSTSGYGMLSSHGGGTPSPSSSIFDFTTYLCDTSTPCPVVNCTPSSTETCSDLFLLLPTGASVPSNTDALVTLPGITAAGTLQCISTVSSTDTNPADVSQGFGPVCPLGAYTPPTNCDSFSITGDVATIPSACLAGGVSYFFDDANGDASAFSVVLQQATTPEPSGAALVLMGLASLGLFWKRTVRA